MRDKATFVGVVVLLVLAGLVVQEQPLRASGDCGGGGPAYGTYYLFGGGDCDEVVEYSVETYEDYHLEDGTPLVSQSTQSDQDSLFQQVVGGVSQVISGLLGWDVGMWALGWFTEQATVATLFTTFEGSIGIAIAAPYVGAAVGVGLAIV